MLTYETRYILQTSHTKVLFSEKSFKMVSGANLAMMMQIIQYGNLSEI